jgi:Kelch motif
MRLALAAVAAAGLAGCGLALGTVGTWTTYVDPPQVLPLGASTVALPAGRVVVLGGFSETTGEPAGETLVFDAGTGRWSQGPSIPEPRTDPVVVALKDGEVLMAGGTGPYTFNQPAETLATAWILDPVAGSWRRTGSMKSARSGAHAVLLSDGRVLVVGGSVPSSDPNQPFTTVAGAEVFDPRSGLWTSAGVQGRDGDVLVALPGGKALAAGGCQESSASSALPPGVVPISGTGQQAGLAGAEEFDGAGWGPVSAMPSPRCFAAAAELRDGRVLVVGGTNGGTSLSDAVAFDSRFNTWASAGSPNLTARGGIALVTLSDGRVFLPDTQDGPRIGGRATLLVGGQVYDPDSGNWTFATTTSLVTAARFGNGGIAGIAPVPPDGAFVLLENRALSLDARAIPPAVSTLDSTGLTWLLLAVVATLLAALAVARLRSS